MSVRTRMLLIVGGVTLLTTLALGVGSTVWSLATFRAHERDDVERDADLVERALDRDRQALDNLVADWALWDDTYGFVATGDPGYVESNLFAGTLTGLDIDLLAIVDRAGQVRWGGEVDATGQELVAADPRLLAELAPGGLLHVTGTPAEGVSGLLRLGDELLLVASWPVSDGEGTAPARGVMAMARWVDEMEVASIGQRVLADVRLAAPGGEPGVVLTDRDVSVRRPLLGLQGDVVADVIVQDELDVVASGRSSLTRLIVAMAVGLLASGAALLVLGDRLIGRRLRRLEEDAERIASSSEPSGRVRTGGADEIGRLADVLNGMLASLERSRQEVEGRNAELEAATAAKDDFVSTVSHELRTPLTVLRAVTETLLAHGERLEPESRHDLLLRADRNGRRLERLVNDLLVLSRVTDGRVVAQPQELALEAVVHESLLDAPTEGLELDLPAGAHVVADPDHVHRMLTNLVDNAVKYGAAPVVVRARVTAAGLRIEVEDHGPGVPEQFLPSLFDRFTQADTGDRRACTGTGLGLAIVSTLVAANGGTVTYESGAAGGARFVLELPGGLAPRQALAAPVVSGDRPGGA